jgi:hypothetical protein
MPRTADMRYDSTRRWASRQRFCLAVPNDPELTEPGERLDARAIEQFSITTSALAAGGE